MTPSLGFGETLRIPGLRRLWLAQIVSIFGDFLAIFAVFSLVTFRLHGNPTQVTMILVAYLLPLAFVGPLAGAFVDRWDVRTTMIASDLIRCVLVLLLLFVQNLTAIYAIFLALSTVSSFFLPAQSITLRSLVPREGLMSANALMSQAVQVMQIVSPAAAGALAAWFGTDSCFLLDAVSFVFSAAMIAGLEVNRPPEDGPSTVRSLAASIVEGMRFILTHGAVSFVIVAMTAGMFALRCFSALIAVYVRDILAAGPMLFGALSSLVGCGMIVGTQLINKFGRRYSRNHLVVGGLCGIGCAILATAWLGSVPGTVGGMPAIGFGVAFVMIPAQTLLQEETPKAMLGRVSSSLWSVLSMAQVAAMLIAGPVARWIGIRDLYFASGLLLLSIAAVGYWQLQRSRIA